MKQIKTGIATEVIGVDCERIEIVGVRRRNSCTAADFPILGPRPQLHLLAP